VPALVVARKAPRVLLNDHSQVQVAPAL